VALASPGVPLVGSESVAHRPPRALLETVRAGIAVGLVAATTAILIACGANLAEAVAILLLIVFGASMVGYVPGLCSAFTGFFVLNYYFTTPRHTFSVERPEDLVVLFTFVVIAVIVATGVGRLNELRVQSQRGEREALLRLHFTNGLIVGADPDDLLDAAAHELVNLFELASCSMIAGTAHAEATSDRRCSEILTVWSGTFCMELGLHRALAPNEVHTVEALAASLSSSLERMRLDGERRAERLHTELARSRAAFLTAMTHDLRTPLATIRAATSTLATSGSRLGTRDRQRMAAVAHDEAARLEGLITKVLEVSRIRSGPLSPVPTEICVADEVGVAVLRLETVLGDRHIVSDIDPELPAVWVDSLMLEHVLVNLLENAFLYGGTNGPIEVGASRQPTGIEVRVIDHGPGIPAADRERAFQEFVRVGAQASTPGTGLGLTIVREFVEANGGTIEYEDTPGGGATFVVALPVAEPVVTGRLSASPSFGAEPEEAER
jgi:two-component system sensor histidine kinase KdpD